MSPPPLPQIGINLADPIFRGVYHGTQRHDDDLAAVVDRARQVGCAKLVVTGSSFQTSRDALALADAYPGTVYATAGIHPCSSSIFDASRPPSHHLSAAADDDDSNNHTPACEPVPDPDPDQPVPDDQVRIDPAHTQAIIDDLRALVQEGRRRHRLVALGEFGLDYDRLHYCPAALQRHAFAAQLRLAAALAPPLPLFLHSRAAHADFVAGLRAAFGDGLERLEKGGVVHSFTGTAAEAAELMGLGLYVGLNGCSFKTAENCEVVKAVRLDRLMLETDGPWCEVRPSHEGWKYLVDMEKKEKEAAAGVAAATTEPPSQQTENGSAAAAAGPQAQNKQQQQQQAPRPQKASKKPPKKEPEVTERFRTVKKEKWVPGAMVKGRNEPCAIERVAKIVAAIKGVSVEEVCEAAWRNTAKVFGGVVEET